MARRKRGWSWLKVLANVGALIPLMLIAWGFWQGSPTSPLMINPFQDITLRTGNAAIVLLILSLAVTPIVTVFGTKQVIPLRKILGLYAFMYAAIHFSIFVVDNGLVENNLDLMAVYEATFEKRFALAGFVALMILLPLAITSNRWSMRQLRKNWKRLHRFVYLAGILAVAHFVWLVKSDYREPLIYGAILTLLLVLRIPAVRRYVVSLRSRLGNRNRPLVDRA